MQLFPICDSCLKGKKMVGKPKKYEFKEGKIKWRILAQHFCMQTTSIVYGDKC